MLAVVEVERGHNSRRPCRISSILKTVTILPDLHFYPANAPAAEVTTGLTASLPITPTRAVVDVLSAAVTLPSYSLLLAVIPVMVNAFLVILAVVEG